MRIEDSIKVRRLTSQLELDTLVENAKADDHLVLFPSHVVCKNGKIVGYGSINKTPIVNVWLSSKEIGPRDSMQLLSIAESIASSNGLDQIIMPCAEKSPFFPLMERMGFTRLGFTSLNVKSL